MTATLPIRISLRGEEHDNFLPCDEEIIRKFPKENNEFLIVISSHSPDRLGFGFSNTEPNMSDQTPNLSLPYILPSQSQKHVTHNEALQSLDAITQLIIADVRSAPPSNPAEGACYAISTGATGEWLGKSGLIALYIDAAWQFITPKQGWIAWFVTSNDIRVFRNGAWSNPDPWSDNVLELVGVNAAPDTTNRLSVSSQASLFNHAGNGHQMKLNKAAVADTASLLFQSNWSWRAEMGLAGTDQFEIKVSADGSAWASALKILGNGTVLSPQRPLVRAANTAGVAAPGSGTRTGFSVLGITQGGFSLGAAVPNGTGNRLLVPVTGPYLISLSTSSVAAANANYTVSASQNGTNILASVRDSDAGTSSYSQNAVGLAFLSAGDWLSLEHTGNASFEFGIGKTELMAVML